MCHTVRGTPAGGRAGPDLTHVGSRHSLAAGVLPNERGSYGAWIAGNQAIKPGARMPEYRLAGPDLVALATYLEGLT
jgi:cytochrome c oxidase subunit 2